MKPIDVVDFYWSVPENLQILAKYFPKVKTKKELKYIAYALGEIVNNIQSGINQIDEE